MLTPVGSTVLLHSLVSRPALNGRRGTVVTDVNKRSGRVGVLVEGEDVPIALKPANLIDAAAEAMEAVFTSTDLLWLVFSSVGPWERAGILSAVCTVWRTAVWSQADLFRSIVVLSSEELKKSVPTKLRSRGLHRGRQYDALFMMEEGALPRLPSDLRRINPAWVETLYVVLEPEDLGDFLDSAPHFPRLATACIANIDEFCSGAVDANYNRLRAQTWQTWFSNHLPTLRHLSVNNELELVGADGRIAETVELFDMATQPGLASLRLEGSFQEPSLELKTVRGWSKAARRSMTALDLTSYPSVDDLIEMVRLLPELRRLSWKVGAPQAEEIQLLAAALSHSKLEALYLSMDSGEDLPTNMFHPFAQARTPRIALLPRAAWSPMTALPVPMPWQVSTLVELVVGMDSCSFDELEVGMVLQRGGLYEMLYNERADGSDIFRVATRLTHEALRKRVAVLVCSEGALRDTLDPLHRAFLPTTEEEWHLALDTCGRENLPFLGAEEAAQLQSTVQVMDQIWNGRIPPPKELPGEVYDAACDGDAAAVEAWLDGGGNVNAPLIEDGSVTSTLLMVSTKNLPVVELLLSRGAALDVQNDLGWTALMGAAFEGSVAAARRLLEAGADPNLQNNNGNTALSVARQRGHTEMVHLLIEYGATELAPPGPDGGGLSNSMMGLFAQLLRRSSPG